MSTICKINPLIRQQRRHRANLLRNPPQPRMRTPKRILEMRVILVELSLIQQASHLTGATKQMLFERGAQQMSRL